MHHPSTLDLDHPPRHLLDTHIGGHNAATGAGEGQEEEGCRAQEASSTNQRVSPGVGAAKAAADLHAEAHTQDPSEAGDESEDETRGQGGKGGLVLLLAKPPHPQGPGMVHRSHAHNPGLSRHRTPWCTKLQEEDTYSQTRKLRLCERKWLCLNHRPSPLHPLPPAGPASPVPIQVPVRGRAGVSRKAGWGLPQDHTGTQQESRGPKSQGARDKGHGSETKGRQDEAGTADNREGGS